MTNDALLALLRVDVVAAARALLGATLVRGTMRARIVETEAYRAADDPASHAYRRQTPRNTPMYGPPGRAYVYLNYGMHWMLNVAAHPEGEAAAVLIRAAEPLEGLEEMRTSRPTARRDEDLLSGPGKVCRAFGITGVDNGRDLFADPELRLVAGEQVSEVLVGPRIGIAEGKGHETPWRFCDAGALRWVSRPLPPR